MRILLVEDDAVLRKVLCASLSDAGHRVDEAATLAHTRALWHVQSFDAVLLDLNLPDGSGLNALREARRRGDSTPVLILSARDRATERIAGLDAGADDYLGKPFDLGEVEARLRALIRRVRGTQDEVAVGALALDRRLRRFTLNDQALELPAREFEVLWELMTPPGRVVSKRELSEKLSSFDEALGDNALEAFISRLRKKLSDAPGSGIDIRTLRGLGYMLVTQTRDES
jgi:two-component system OmpR family response regulator